MTSTADRPATTDPAPRVRVVVLNWNAPGLTKRCVHSLLRSTYPRDQMDIVIVDNGSIDGSVPMLRDAFPDVSIVENGTNLGFAEGCNRAMADLDGIDAVALVNNDATVAPGWLEPLVERCFSADDIGAVSPKMLFDTMFERIEVTAQGDGDRVELVDVTVDGVNAMRRTMDGDGVVLRPDPAIPLGLHREFANHAVIHVPVGRPHARISLTFAGDRPVEVAAVNDGASTPTTAQPVDGSITVTVGGSETQVWVINSLGTSLTEWNEGVENHFGEPDHDIESTTVDGWSGGGVLLRADYLADVGRFDPTFFAYYEDTDLSWRGRRAGWRTVTEPGARLFHLHGGSAGSGWPGFFFLNYRNWLLTVSRNGDLGDVRAAFAVAKKLSWPFFRTNVFGKVRRLQRPDTRITARWLRVLAGYLGALPRTLGARPVRTGRLLGSTPVERPASALLPLAPPRAPSVQPGGDTLVYVDVTETLRAGWRAGIQRVVTELVTRMLIEPSTLNVVPVCWSDLDESYRQLSTEEMERFLHPAPVANHAPPPIDDSRFRAAIRPITSRDPVRSIIDRRRTAAARATRPASHADLVISDWAGPSLFLDIDATWNLRAAPRSAVLADLSAAGVRVVSLQHDILPMTNPEWFDPNLVRVFGAHLRAHLAHDALILTNSDHTGQQVAQWAADNDEGLPPLHTIRLGAELPDRTDHSPADAALLDSLDGQQVVLVVGTIEPRKNHQRLIDAFDQLGPEHRDATLVIVGREGWKVDRLARGIRQHREFGTRIRWPEVVSDATLEQLYGTAAVVAVPSLDEGFGLPLAEALLHRCRVISSNAGALPEVGQDAPRYFDPESVDEIAAALDDALSDARLDAAVATTSVRTWDDATAELIGVLTAVAAAPIDNIGY